MMCVDCPYYWIDEDEKIACCHCPDSLTAPCEEEEVEDYNNDYYEEEIENYNDYYEEEDI